MLRCRHALVADAALGGRMPVDRDDGGQYDAETGLFPAFGGCSEGQTPSPIAA